MNKEGREKPYFFRRVVAYLIDIILVTLLATSISMVFIDNKAYQSKTDEMMALMKNYTNGEITKEEYSKQYEDLNYYIVKEGVGTSIVNCGVALVYYVVLCFFCHGITLGKYIMKLRIVSANTKELNMGNYLIRGLFVNLILSNLISVIFVSTMAKDTFNAIYPKISSILSLFLLVTILFIMYRDDGRGLHDLMSNTEVISTKVKKGTTAVKEENEIVDAKVIEEKETTTKEKNKRKQNKKSKKKEQ